MPKRRQQNHIRRILTFILLILTLLGCALLDPPTLFVPTPFPTAPPLPSPSAGQAPVTDPVSNVVPDIDPDIATLVNAVSQQQLTAYVKALEDFGTRSAFSTTEDPAFGIGAARKWITDEFQRVGELSNGRLRVEINEFTMDYEGFNLGQQNVVATLPGTTQNSDVIILMAHYDTRTVDLTDGASRAPGANDNGSGVALLIETARLLSPRTWNQTIVFAALAAEEQGTFGAKDLVNRAIREDWNVIAAINYDTVGGRPDIPRSIRLFALDTPNAQTDELARFYQYIGGLYVPTMPITIINELDREGRFGDQREFIQAGLPGIRLTESIEDPQYINSTRDIWSVIDYDYLQQVTQLNVALVANMAGAPPRPLSPTIVKMENDGAYWLTWPPDPQAAGYAISFRPLDSNSYPTFRFVNSSQAGNIVLTGIDNTQIYAVSMAAIDENRRISLFSPEVIIAP